MQSIATIIPMPCIRSSLLAAVFLVAVGWTMSAPTSAQTGRTVGDLRIGDASGNPVGQVPDAGPGEKVYRLESGTSTFRVWLNYDGAGATPVQLRVMAPQGVIIDQKVQDLEEPGSYDFEFDFDPPLDDNEYVINAYVGDSSYLADSLQLLIGDAELIPADNVQQETIPMQTVPADSAGPAAASVPADNPAAEGLGPSPMLLVVAGLGLLVLLGVVVWSGMAAMRAR